jgi:protein arginine N-methyltransferase 1
MSFDNLYVQRMTPADLAGGEASAVRWDAIDFTEPVSGQRRGKARWELPQATDVFGFAIWWRCELVPGVSLTTSPFAAPTHWDQVHAPVAVPVRALSGDVLELSIESETGGGEAGIGMRWEIRHLRSGEEISHQEQDIGRGQLG